MAREEGRKAYGLRIDALERRVMLSVGIPYEQDWMSQVSGYLLLSEINIPGTHDTAAMNQYYQVYRYDDAYVTQDMTLSEQLGHGIRYLDIRAWRDDDGTLSVHHSNKLECGFSDVLDDCRGFLTDHPRETIIMCIKNEGGSGGDDDFFHSTRDYLDSDKYRDLFWRTEDGQGLPAYLPTLEEVRGKVVLLRRFTAYTHPYGISVTDWPDNDTHEWTNGDGVSFYVQDNFKVYDDPKNKWEDHVHPTLSKAQWKSLHTWFINFTSGANGLLPATVAWGYDDYVGVNSYLNDYVQDFSSTERPRLGTIAMDFPEYDDHHSAGHEPLTCSLIHHIIELNRRGPSSVWVDDDFTPSTEGFGQTRFSTIVDAVKVVGFGGTIFVNPGVYDENVVLDPPVTVLFQPGSATVNGLTMVHGAIDATDCDLTILGDYSQWGGTLTLSLDHVFAVDGGFDLHGGGFRRYSGAGTEESPYGIHDVYGLQGVTLNTGAHFRLETDLDLSVARGWNGGEGFAPIGNAVGSFRGLFDGAGHTIRGLYVNTDKGQAGLFGLTQGYITRVRLEDADVRGGFFVGAIVGQNAGTLTDATASGRVVGVHAVGGLVGWNETTVVNCHSDADVSGESQVGGLIGFNDMRPLTDCWATGTVSGGATVGGLIGYSEGGDISRCYATGDVSGESLLGGLLGLLTFGTVADCYATGNVTADGPYAVLGGLVGEIQYDGAATRSYSTGRVTLPGQDPTSLVGGLVGYLAPLHPGDVTVTASFYNVQTAAQNDTGKGEPRTTEEMRTAATFQGWDFDDTWSMVDGLMYPALRWRSASDRIAAGFGGALAFDGESGMAALPPTLNGLSDWTFSAWIRPEVLGEFVYSEGQTARHAFHIRITETGRLEVYAFGGYATVFTTSEDGAVQPGQWSFIAATLAGGTAASGALTVYINDRTYTGQLAMISNPTFTQAALGVDVWLLGLEPPPTFFRGQMDEVRFFDRALAPSEVVGGRSRPLRGDEPGLVRYCRMDELTGGTLWDEVSNSGMGWLTAGATRLASTLPIACVLDEDGIGSGQVFGAGISGGPLSFAVADRPQQGYVELNPLSGDYAYTPLPDWNGDDTFTFRVSDAGVWSANAYPVHVLVRSVNDPPAAGDETYAAIQGAPLHGATVLWNDSDEHAGAPGENNLPLTARLVSDVVRGALTFRPDGTFVYTSDPAFIGTDQFTYEAVDALGGVSSPATVTVRVEPAWRPIYVNASASGANTGTSWADAYTELQPALADAARGAANMIWVAAGTYRPDFDPATGVYTNDRAATFVVPDGVAILGGFAGGEIFPDQADPETHPTILTGDIGVRGLADDNTLHIVTVLNAQSDQTRLFGLTLRDGHAGDAKGGAILTTHSLLRVEQCGFLDNQADRGGAIRVSGGSLTVWDSLFESNAANYGGAIDAEPGALYLTACVFQGNTAARCGGALFIWDLSGGGEVRQSVFANNVAGGGGGVSLSFGDYTFDGCLFVGNVAAGTPDGVGGGGMDLWQSSVLRNCTFVANVSQAQAARGGGIFVENGSPVLTHCILWANQAGGSMRDNQLAYYYSGITPQVSLSAIQGWPADPTVISLDPLFVNAALPAGPDGRWRTADDGLRLQPSSPCLDAPAGPHADSDLLNHPIPQGASADMGAYEFVPSLLLGLAQDGDAVTPRFQAGGGPVKAAGDCFLSGDAAPVLFASVTLTGRPDGTQEELLIVGALPEGISVLKPYDSTDGALVLQGQASAWAYGEAVRRIAYVNHSDSPHNAVREIVIRLGGGVLDADEPVQTTVHLDVFGPPNRAPAAQNDACSVNEDDRLVASSVLLNDTDPDGDPLTAVLVAGPARAAHFALAPDGTFSYVPAADWNGTDTFTYRASDGWLDGNAATVAITVQPVNDPPIFAKGPNQTTRQSAGPQTVAGWATAISPGPENESFETVHFVVTTDRPDVFSVQPAVAPDGTLTYTPSSIGWGVALVTVTAVDDGGTANGGRDASAPQTFSISSYPGAAGQPPGAEPPAACRRVIYTDTDGTRVTLSFSGCRVYIAFDGDSVEKTIVGKTLRVTDSDGRVEVKTIAVSESSGRAALKIATDRGGDGLVRIGGLLGGVVGRVAAKTAILTGGTVLDGLSRLDLAGMDGATVSIAGALDRLTTGWVADTSLQAASAGLWTVRGTVSDSALGAADGLARLDVKGGVTGSRLRFNQLASLRIGGDLAEGASGGSLVEAWRINDLRIGGLLSASTVAAGVAPGSDGYFDGDETAAGGGLGRVRIGDISRGTGGGPFGLIAAQVAQTVRIGRTRIAPGALPWSDGDGRVVVVA